MFEPEKPLVIISYSREDEEWLERLRTQLDVLAQYGHIEVWDDRQIAAGEDKYFALDERLERATIAICLISAHYLASSFIRKQEVNFLLERRQRDGLLLVPILISPCVWRAVPWLKRLKIIPRDGRPVPKGLEQDVLAEAAGFIYEYASERTEGVNAAVVVRGASPPRDDYTIGEPYAGGGKEDPSSDEDFPFPLDAVTTSKGLAPAAPAPVADVEVDIQRLPVTGYKLFGRDKELDLLDDAWESTSTHVLALIAWGGVGKSTLVNSWLEGMEADCYRGARRVFGWSFHSQGTKGQVTSADYFFDETLRWFGATDFEKLSPWDKGMLLADLVKTKKALLVLDGLEPLQSGSQFDRGTIKDPGLKTLLAELIRQNSGLCVVTSREKLADFAAQGPAISSIDLEHIAPEAGRSLLRVGRVRGSDEELEQATREFGGHALAINLLAAYLHEIPGHDVSSRSRIPDLDIPEEKGRHPRRVLVAIEELLGEGLEIDLLRVLGLFDRPAPNEQIYAVADGAPLEGLTTHLHGLSNERWDPILERLRELGLARPSACQPDDLDAHPLVREHFAEQLDERYRDALNEAHRRLFEHLKQSAPDLPTNLQEMTPLFHAVTHGCSAGLYEEAYVDVYSKRIQRGSEFFNTRKLGAIGAEMAALSAFFIRGWSETGANLSQESRGDILSEAGFNLRALGRLTDAAEPMNAALSFALKIRRSWKTAAESASNLSELYLTLGDAAAAVSTAEQSVEVADRSGDIFLQMAHRTTLGDALHQSDRGAQSLAVFRAAESMQQKRQPKYPLLYSLQGFRYCALLLDGPWAQAAALHNSEAPTGLRSRQALARCLEVRDRVERTLEWVKLQHWLLDIGLDYLTLSQTYLLEALLKSNWSASASESPELALAQQCLSKSVSRLREAESQDHLPRGLLSRAALARLQKRFHDAEHDLAEAESIADRGSMLTFQIDTAVEGCRLSLAMNDHDAARECLDRAKQVIQETEKPYQPHVPDWPDWDHPPYVNVFKPGEIVGYHRRNPEIAILEEALSTGEKRISAYPAPASSHREGRQ